MATEYLVDLAITLRPLINQTPPQVVISVPGQSVEKTLTHTEKIDLRFSGCEGWITVNFLNKNYNEAQQGSDMAVLIEQVEFFGISDPKFVWAGLYQPHYPEPWYSEQKIQPDPTLKNQNYLGWNGQWKLDFDLPVFTWMHQILSMGWIYH